MNWQGNRRGSLTLFLFFKKYIHKNYSFSNYYFYCSSSHSKSYDSLYYHKEKSHSSLNEWLPLITTKGLVHWSIWKRFLLYCRENFGYGPSIEWFLYMITHTIFYIWTAFCQDCFVSLGIYMVQLGLQCVWLLPWGVEWAVHATPWRAVLGEICTSLDKPSSVCSFSQRVQEEGQPC